MLIFLLLLWIIFNGTFTLEILLFGIAISAVVFLFLVKFMGYSIRKEIKLICKLPFVIAYLFVLLEEIVKANIVCAGLIIKGNRKIEPALVSFPSPLKSEMLSTVLANSITLTPGTISVTLKDGRFCVHCLDKSLYEGINDSIFVKLLKKMGD